MEFNWHLNWWYRPNGFESSVADYYECFCDWMGCMKLNLCPAVEADYVQAFIQNLRSDIRSRLESKGRPSMRRLSDAFYDAKLEECLISMEEAFKKFEVRNLAPRNAAADGNSIEKVLESSKMSCCDEVVVQVETEVEDTVLANTDQKVFDVMPKPTSTTIGEELNVDDGLDSQAGASNEDLDNSEAYSLAFEALIWLFEEEQAPPSTGGELFGNEVGQLSASEAKGVKDGRHLFEEMPKSVFTVEAFKMVEKSTRAILLRLKSKPEVVKVSCRRNAKAVISYEEINGGMDSIPLIDCVPRVFDPGTSIINGDLGDVEMLNMHFPSFCMNRVLIQPSVIETSGELNKEMYAIQGKESPLGFVLHDFDTGVYLLIDDGEISVLVFDPGGGSWYHMVWCSIKTYMDKLDFGFKVGEHKAGSALDNIVVQARASKLFAEIIGPIKADDLWGIQLPNIADYLLGGDPTHSPIDSDEGLSALSYEEVVLGVGFTIFPSMSKLEFDPQVFDPGIAIHLRKGLVNHLNENEGQLNDLMIEPFQLKLLSISVGVQEIIHSQINDATLSHNLDHRKGDENKIEAMGNMYAILIVHDRDIFGFSRVDTYRGLLVFLAASFMCGSCSSSSAI